MRRDSLTAQYSAPAPPICPDGFATGGLAKPMRDESRKRSSDVVLHPSSEVLLRTLGVLSVWHRWQRKRKRAWFMLKAALGITDRERWKNPSDPGTRRPSVTG
jgi:hypothetical protein